MGLARQRGPSGGAGVRAVAAALLSLLALPSVAAPTTMLYRCTAPDGAIALQDTPCPLGQRQERREIAAFAPPPPSTPRPLARAENAGEALLTQGITPGKAPPPRRGGLPPPLWRCTDLNGLSRLSDTYDPQPRCVPLSVLGVDLSRAPPSAATLCQTVEDTCVELDGEATCAAWGERLDAAESALRHAFSDTQAARRRDRDRAKAVVENDCRD